MVYDIFFAILKFWIPKVILIISYVSGDKAVGDGVKRHFFGITMDKLQFGFQLNLGETNYKILWNGKVLSGPALMYIFLNVLFS